MGTRFQSLKEFWPYYLNEHKNPVSRRLHFLGTTGFLGAVAASTALNPIGFPAALAGMAAIGKRAIAVEKKERSVKHVLGMIALPTLASPVLFPAGVVLAYGCAWIGHFGYEKNRPATFEYPVMSLTSDLKMWSHMLRGRLWSGTSPAEDLGVETAPEVEPAPESAASAAA